MLLIVLMKSQICHVHNVPFDSVPGVLGFVTLNPGPSLSFPENGKRRFSPF